MVRLDKKIFKGIEDGQRAFKGPQIVQIDLTGFCNNDCIGCWVHSPLVKNPPRDKNVVLSFQKIRGLIDSLFALGTQEIFLSGAGDPFMHPEIMEIIKLIKKRGFKLNIITNMLLLDEQKARKIVDAGVDLITSSVWAGTGEGYVKTHPGKSEKDFKTIGDNLKALVRQKELKRRFLPRVKVYNVICNLNYQEIRAMVNFAFSCRVDSVEFQVMDLIPEDTSFLALSAEHICQIKEQFDSLLEHDKLYFRRELLQFNSLCGNTPELKEFPGRFLMLPEGFSIFNGRRISLSRDPEEEVYKSIICPKGEISGCTLNNFSCDEANNIFYFPFSRRQCAPHKCRRCRFNWKRQLPAKFMKITGYGSFMRRLDSADLYDNNYENDLVDKVPCYVGWTYCRVLSTGEVIPCCKGVNKPLGDINKQGFTEIWNSSSYREFRNKAKFLSKNDPYFNEISCRKSCDNVGINLQIHQQVMKKKEPPGEDEDRILPSGQPSGKLSLRVLKSRSKVIVQAVSFDRGNVNSNKHNFGQGLIIDGGYHFALAEYDIFFKSSGSYELWSKYAASDPRPVDIYFDDNLIFSGGLNCATGGWHKKYVKSFKEGVLKVDAGPHTLKIFTKKLIPHIQEFIFCPAKGRDGGREAVYETENIFSKPEALKLLKYTAGRFGFLYAAGKLLKHIGKGKFLRDYLDVMGIYQGQYAFCGPGHVQIDLTYNCNNDCIGCWCNSPLLEEKSISSRKKAETLPLGLLIELIDQLSVMGTKEIYFSGGGEPFIHPQIMEILEYAKKKKFICYVNTNFTLLDKERLKRLIDLGVDHLTVSTWAASAATYAATHPNKDENTFRRIVENLEFLNKNKKEVPYIKLYNVIFNLNYHEINDMIRLAQDTGSESVEFTLIDTIPGKTDRLLLAPDQIKYLQEEGRRISDCMDENGRIGKVVLFRFDSFLRRISSSADLRSATYDRNIIDKIPCYIGWCFARIMPNGDVNACLKAHRIPTGNLYQDAFGRIWNGQKQREFRKKTLVYEKNDPFFRLIGNDPCTKEAGCYKSCDDIGRNVHMHNRMMSLTFLERALLKAAARIGKRPRINYLSVARSSDLILDGIRNGREAFIGPEQVVLDLTNRCNLKCAGCWLYSSLLKQKSDKTVLSQEMDYEVAKKLISQLAELGSKRIRFTGGGEPFLHPRIMELLEYAKSKGLICCLTTNFSLLDKEKIKNLIRIGVDELAISLWAASPEIYQKTHPGCPLQAFEKIRENLVFLSEEKKRKPVVTLSNVICNLNYAETEEMFKFALKMKADGVYFTLLDTLEGTESLLLDQDQKNDVLRQSEAIRSLWHSSDVKDRIRLEFFEGFIRRIKNDFSSEADYDRGRINEIPCYAGWSFSRILAGGEVVPCCRGVKKVMGNINKSDFKDIWLSQGYREFRSKAKYLPKEDPYFLEIGCLKMCDNLMHNEQMQARIQGKRSA